MVKITFFFSKLFLLFSAHRFTFSNRKKKYFFTNEVINISTLKTIFN